MEERQGLDGLVGKRVRIISVEPNSSTHSHTDKTGIVLTHDYMFIFLKTSRSIEILPLKNISRMEVIDNGST